MKKTKSEESTQLVAIELVMGKPKRLKTGSALIEICRDDIRVLMITG